MNYNFNQIKEHYEFLTPQIYKAAAQKINRWTSPYCDIDWPSTFSPIEMDAWQAIRGFGKAPLYPQYPVNRFYVDFGNPVVKIALECDGKEWHQDKVKDQRRDEILYNEGWTVYRISGSEIYKPVSDEFYQSQEEDYSDEAKHKLYSEYYSDTIEGLINAIAYFHFDHKSFYIEDEFMMAYRCLTMRCSIRNDKTEYFYYSKLNELLSHARKEQY